MSSEELERICRAAYDCGATDATEEIAGVYPLDDFSMDRIVTLAESRKAPAQNERTN